MRLEQLETELKHLIVEALELEDVTSDQIDSEAPLFVEAMGLDAIDALELARAFGRKDSVTIKADDASNREIFASVRNIAAHIKKNTNTA